jgi:NAD(P)H-flavin reductase
MVRDSLLATLQFFSGDRWSAELAADWWGAFDLVAGVMVRAAAAEEGAGRPAVWRGLVASCERRGPDVAVLQVRPEPALGFAAGQCVAVCSPRRPRLWRYYSIANAPRPDGSLEFHVRLVDGGQVSGVLTDGQAAGEELLLGPPTGALRLDESGRDVVMVAGSTGLAPLKALCEQLAAEQGPAGERGVRLFVCARTREELYDLPALEKLAAEQPWLVVTPAVTADSRFAGEQGPVAEVVARGGNWSGREAYLAGPSPMVEAVSARLAAGGTPQERIHTEDFGWSEP